MPFFNGMTSVNGCAERVTYVNTVTTALHNPVLFGTDSGNYPAGDSGGIRHPFRPISGRFLMFSGMGAG